MNHVARLDRPCCAGKTLGLVAHRVLPSTFSSSAATSCTNGTLPGRVVQCPRRMWLHHLDACAESVLTPHDYITNVQKRLGSRVWVGGGQCRCCGSFLDPQLEHAETCSTAEATRGHYACVRAVVCGMKLADPGITTEPRGLTAPGQLIFSPALLSPDAVRPWMCAWPPPLQQQPAETPHRWRSIVNLHVAETKSGNCGNRAFTTALFFGRRTDDRTWPLLEHFSTQQTLHLAGMANRCRRNRFSASGNTKSKLLSCNGGQPWHAQFCRVLQREQSGSSLASLTEPCTTGDTSLLLTADPATTTSLTLRLIQQYQTTTTLSHSRAMRMSLCSHQVSNYLVCPRVGKVVSGRRWLSRATSRTRNSAVQCPLTFSTLSTFSRTTGSQGNM